MSTIHTAKAFVKGVIGRLVFRDATVTRAEALGPHFRRLVLGGPGLGGATWSPGDKLQVFLPGVGTRAYTPVRWDAAAGETEHDGLEPATRSGALPHAARTATPAAAMTVLVCFTRCS